jgi:hypothetical protein
VIALFKQRGFPFAREIGHLTDLDSARLVTLS